MKVCYIMLLLLLYFSDDIELIDGSDNSKKQLDEQTKLDQFRAFLGLINDDRKINVTNNKSKNNLDSLKSRGTDGIVEWKKILEKLLEVRCTNDTMTVLIHYESSYSRLTAHIANDIKNAEVFALDSNSLSCVAIVSELNGYTNLTFNYKDCNTRRTIGEVNNSVKFVNTIIVYFNNSTTKTAHLKGIKESFEVTCYSGVDVNKIVTTQHLLVFEEQHSKEAIKFPKTISKGSSLYLHGRCDLTYELDFDIEVFPVNCWLAQFPHSSVDKSKYYFLTEGCPPTDYRGHGLSRVFHYRNKPTLVGFSIDNSLLLAKQQSMSITCEVIPCVKSFTNGVVGLLKCPISHYCAGSPLVTHKLPTYLRSVPRVQVTAGPVKVEVNASPINVILGSSVKTKSEKLSTSKVKLESSSSYKRFSQCREICFKLNSTINSTNHDSNLSKFDEQQIKVETAVAVGFVSFLVGLITMAFIWALHFNISQRGIHSNRRKRHNKREKDEYNDQRTTGLISVGDLDNPSSTCIINTLL